MTIDLSICPIFKCNLNCSFCYLGNLKQNKDILDIKIVEKLLNEYDIRVLDVYGGEISLLDEEYSKEFLNVIKNNYIKDTKRKIGVTTNGINFSESPFFRNINPNKIDLSFSFDLYRKCPGLIATNIYEFDVQQIDFSVICLDIDHLDYDFLNNLYNLKSLSIKPYSPSIYNKSIFQSKILEIFKTIHDNYPKLFKKLELVNDFRDMVPHYFLLPDGKLYDIQYDTEGYEYFEEIDKCKNSIDCKCLSCKFFGKCFNEHLNTYNPANRLTNECLGRKSVMNYLEEIRKQDR